MNYFIKNAKLIALIFPLFVLLTAFVSINNVAETEEDINGCWVYKSYKKGAYTYVKKSDFKSSKPGYKFLKDGKMTKRLDPHWCIRVKGPYANLDGTYELLENNVLKTSYKCPVAEKPSINEYKILKLTSKKLVIKSLPRKKK